MTKLQENWICENCLIILGPVIDDDTTCNCHDQIYGIAWSRIDMAQEDMDQAAEFNKKNATGICSEERDCHYFNDGGCSEKCASFMEHR